MFLKKLRHKYIPQYSVSAFASVMMATSAAALVADTVVYEGEFTADTDTWDGTWDLGGTSIEQGTFYVTVQVTVTDADQYSFLLTHEENSSQITRRIFYTPGEFDPADGSNYLDFGDDVAAADVDEGQYLLVISEIDPGFLGAFTYEFTGLVFGWGPLLEEIAGDQIKVASNQVAQALSASIFSAVKSGLAGGTPVVSREAPGLNTTEGNRTWFQMDYTAIDGTDLDGRFPTMQAGLDFQLENGMIVGAALGYSDFSITSAASDLDGTSLSIQPYLGFSAGELTGAVTLSFGKLDLETTDGAGTAEGDTRALSLSLERPFALGGNQMIASFDGGFGRQEIDSATGSLAGMADTYSTWSYASLGARYEMQAGAALVSFGASVDYNDVGNLDNIAADHYGSDGFTGAVNFGLDYQMGSGSNLYVNAEIGGIGGDALRKSVQAGIDFRF